MFYAHINLSNDVTIKSDLDNIEFSAVCPACGKEFPIDYPDLNAWLEDGEILCDDCTAAIKPFTLYAPGESFGTYDWEGMLTKSDYPSGLFSYAIHHASREALKAAADQFIGMVPGYHDDKPLGEINEELERRGQEAGRNA
jgi:hypothetical protein